MITILLEYIFLGLIIIFVFYSMLDTAKEEKASEKSRDELINKQGFKFEERVSIKRERELHRHGFKFLLTVDDNVKTNVLWKESEEESFYIFDCEYTESTLNGCRIDSKRAIFYKTSNTDLYNFELYNEGMFGKLNSLLGNEYNDFDEVPIFSKDDLLKTKNTETTLSTLPRELVEFISSQKGINIEARESCLLIYDGISNYSKLFEIASKIRDILLRHTTK